MTIVNNISDVSVAMKQWLEGISDGMLAVQPGRQPDIKTPHYLFDLINMESAEFSCSGIEFDDAMQPMQCIVQEYILTYQIDVLHCDTGIEHIVKLLKHFKSGLYIKKGDYFNLAYLNNSVTRRINFFRHQQLYYKTTVDIDFVYRCKECTIINTMETFSIESCDEIDFQSAITVNKP